MPNGDERLPAKIAKILSVAGYLSPLPRHRLLSVALAAISFVCLTLVIYVGKQVLDHLPEKRQYWTLGISAVGFLVAFVSLLVSVRASQPKQAAAVPYGVKGLSSYSDNDGLLFAQLERENEIQRCLDLLNGLENEVIVIYGKSGSGKTSMLRAGVQFRLKQAEASGKPGVPRCVYWRATGDAASSALEGEIKEQAGFICKGDLSKLIASRQRLVIIIDQFERLRRHSPEHQPIFDLIQQAVGQTPRTLHLIVAFNLNYYVEWMEFQSRTGVPSTNIPVGLFTIESAIKVMTAILSHTPGEGTDDAKVAKMDAKAGG